jgi:lycopene cyclase domain-containing protein
MEMPFGKYSYLLILTLWALPVIAIQWIVAGRALWRARRLLLATVVLCSVYLSLADHFAIARGIWQIQEAGILGLRFRGHLPLEEALFFFLTVVMSSQGFVMLAAHFRSRPQQQPQRKSTS